MKIPFTQVDAFVVDGQPLTGNPAAVMPLVGWLPDELLLAIAIENNLSETAFTMPCADDGADFDLRWFTPGCEVAMCGHATLAAGHVLIGQRELIRFRTRKAGILSVRRVGENLDLDLPLAKRAETELGDATRAALGLDAEVILYDGPEPLLVVPIESEAKLRDLVPDYGALKQIDALVMPTAPGERTDFASRVFAGHYGIDEDPVTGSAHAGLAPYWAERLGKSELTAFQASARGGDLHCRLDGDRLLCGGKAITVIEGEFSL